MNPSILQSDLRRLASNQHWTWHPESERFLRRLPGSRPEIHPLTVITEMESAQFELLATDEEFVELLSQLMARIPEQMTSPKIAYCSPEFGLSSTIPIYSGGLGILAGDHLKAASDLEVPLVGVGLLYSEGVFRQVMDDGRQVEKHQIIEPELFGAEDTGVSVAVPFPGRDVVAKVWSLAVGAVRLLLLSTDVEPNSPADRRITDRLYEGTNEHRLQQEMILGVGGARALPALGWNIEVHHLNEGHAGFLALDLIDRNLGDTTLDGAIRRTRKGLVFTTHTPVPAGIDRFSRDLIGPYLELWAERWGVAVEQLWSLGEDRVDGHRFNMANFCLSVSGSANGVSRLHGEVSREMFTGIGIGSDIAYVTNGVHARTWTSPMAQNLFDDVLGPSRANDAQSNSPTLVATHTGK